MCDALKTHTDGHRGLCAGHAYQVKQAGGLVALELEPKPIGRRKQKSCEWDKRASVEPVENSEQPTEE